MIDAILALWIGYEAYRRKFWHLMPVSLLVLLYEAADIGWIRVSEFISMEGTIKKLFLFQLVFFVFLAWRKKQVKVSAMIACALALVSRLAWGHVFDSYLEAIQQPEADYLGILAQGAAVRIGFGALTGVMLLVMQILILVNLRKLPLEKDC